MGLSWLEHNNSFFVFTCMYFLGACIKKYDWKGFKNNIFNILSFVICLLLAMATVFILEGFNLYALSYVWGMRIFTVLAGFFLFCAVMNYGWKHNRLIEHAASATFGIYLIHNGQLFDVIMYNILRLNEEVYKHSDYLLRMLIDIALIFVVCAAIDLLRQGVVKKFLINKFEKLMKKLDLYIEEYWLA